MSVCVQAVSIIYTIIVPVFLAVHWQSKAMLCIHQSNPSMDDTVLLLQSITSTPLARGWHSSFKCDHQKTLQLEVYSNADITAINNETTVLCLSLLSIFAVLNHVTSIDKCLPVCLKLCYSCLSIKCVLTERGKMHRGPTIFMGPGLVCKMLPHGTVLFTHI